MKASALLRETSTQPTECLSSCQNVIGESWYKEAYMTWGWFHHHHSFFTSMAMALWDTLLSNLNVLLIWSSSLHTRCLSKQHKLVITCEWCLRSSSSVTALCPPHISPRKGPAHTRAFIMLQPVDSTLLWAPMWQAKQPMRWQCCPSMNVGNCPTMLQEKCSAGWWQIPLFHCSLWLTST